MTLHPSDPIKVISEQSPSSPLGRLCSAPADVFAREIWSRKPWLSRAGDLPGPPSDVFSLQAADELLSQRGLRTPFIRLAKDGRVLPGSRFTGTGGAGASIADQVQDDAVMRLFADGATVVLQALHRTWPPVGELAAGLSQDLGHPVQVNAYITPPQSQGFAAHYDTHDVFVLQIAGHKRWRVHEPVFIDPLPENPWESVADQVRARADEEPVLDATFEPGDCLYLPRGFIHSAQALGGTSLHLTFGLHATIERDVVKAVMNSLESSGWRASLPAGWDPDSTDGQAQIQQLVDELREALTHVDVQALADGLHDQRAALQRPEPITPLANAALAGNLTRTDTLRLRHHVNLRTQEHPDKSITLVAAGRRLNVAEQHREALQIVLSGDEFAVGDLPLPDDEALDLARRLLLAGIVMA